MITPEAGSDFGADGQSFAAPWYSSRRLWSLWDMINFRFSAAHFVLSELNILISTSKHNMDYIAVVGRYDEGILNDQKNLVALLDCRQGAKEMSDMAKTVFATLKCDHIDDAIKRLERWSSQEDGEWSELNTRARSLRDVIETELKQYYYYQYPKEKAQTLLSWERDWANVLAAFPLTKREIFSAVDCHALGHNTASVFHCMRILEHGLGALGPVRA